MKIAVLISGEYRKFDVCRPNMKFLDDPNVDVYVSTWDRVNYQIPMLNQYINKKVTTKNILYDLGRDAVIQIDPAEIASTLKNKCGVYMMYRWQKGFELIKNSKIDYDYVIITRPDLYINQESILKDLHKFDNALGSPWTRKEEGFLNDVLLISSYSKMVKLFENLSVSEWMDCNDDVDWHSWWYQYALGLVGDIIEYQDIHITMCRPPVEKGMTFDQINNIEIDWQELKILQVISCFPDCTDWPWPIEKIQSAKDKWQSGYFSKYKFL